MKTSVIPASAKNRVRDTFLLCQSVVELYCILFLFFFPQLPARYKTPFMIVALIILTITLLAAENSNCKSLSMNRTMLLLAEIPVLLIYRQLYPRLTLCSLALACALCIDLVTRHFYTPEGWVTLKNVLPSIPRVLERGKRTAAAVCLPVFLLVLAGNLRGIVPEQLLSRQAEDIPESTACDPFRENRHTLSKLDEAVWENLPREDRLEVLQAVMDVELRNMGIPYRPSLIAYPQELSLGYYSSTSRCIFLNTDFLDSCSAEDCLNTLLHELRHVYQHYIAQLYADGDGSCSLQIFSEAQKCYQNFRHYSSTRSNHGPEFDAYYNQYVEQDARNYGKTQTEVYRPYFDPQT